MKGFFQKIFNKLFLLYLLSYLVSMVVLGSLISTYLERAFVTREVEYMDVAAGEAISAIAGNVKLANDIIFSIYVACYTDRSLMDFMSGDYAPDVDSSYRKRFTTYVDNLLSNRDDLRSISYRRGADGAVFSSGTPGGASDGAAFAEALDASGGKGALLPPPARGRAAGYRYVREFNNVITWMRMGTIMMEFRDAGLRALLTRYVRGITCDFVITAGQSVIFQMNGLQGGPGPLTARALSAGGGERGPGALRTFDGREYYILGKGDEDSGIRAVCVIPREEIRSLVKPTLEAVRIVTVSVGVLFVIMLLIGDALFSRRMRALIGHINGVRTGNLSSRSPLADAHDELGVISAHFDAMCRQLQEYIDTTYRYELKQKEADYRLLQMQINPHFLFNTLEAIRMKSALEGFGDAAQMIYNLSLLLRQTTKPVSVNTLRDEIAFCRQYLDLFEPQFTQGLRYECVVPPDCEDCGIIRHIIQPLLENSIVHGLRRDAPGNRLSIEAERDREDILIHIRDNGRGMDEETRGRWNASLAGPPGEGTGRGIGLQNVNDRIRYVYGPGYGLELGRDPSGGTDVAIRLKYLTIEEVLKRVQPADR